MNEELINLYKLQALISAAYRFAEMEEIGDEGVCLRDYLRDASNELYDAIEKAENK